MRIGPASRIVPVSNSGRIVAPRADKPMGIAVRRAISVIQERYHEPITMNDLAAQVFISPFHFSRMFAKATGVTPGRYLTAVRMFEAKRLLLTSQLTISDIVCTVGYSSVGTFTSRFSRAVGMSPSQFREPQVRNLLLAVAPHFQHLPSVGALRDAGQGCAQSVPGGATVTVRIELPADLPPGDVLLGVFAEAIPQCGPVAFTGLRGTRSGTVVLDGVPPGRWLVIAAAEHARADGSTALTTGTLRVPIVVTDSSRHAVRVRTRLLQDTDPPIAITLAARSDRPTSPGTGHAGAATPLPVAA